HARGSMTFRCVRFVGAGRGPAAHEQAPDGSLASAARFFYDISQSTHAVLSPALLQLVPVNHIVFCSDYPFRTTLEHVQGLESARVYSAEELKGIYAGNIDRFLPELMR